MQDPCLFTVFGVNHIQAGKNGEGSVMCLLMYMYHRISIVKMQFKTES